MKTFEFQQLLDLRVGPGAGMGGESVVAPGRGGVGVGRPPVIDPVTPVTPGQLGTRQQAGSRGSGIMGQLLMRSRLGVIYR